MNGRKARERRQQSRKTALSPRAQQLVEEARRERNTALIAAKGLFYRKIGQADQEFRATRHQLDTALREVVEGIERGDRAGILVYQRIEEPS